MDGAHIKMDHIDDLDSVVESRLCVLVSIPSKPKERVLSKRVTNGRLPRVNTCTWSSNGFRKGQDQELLINNSNIYRQGYDTKARFYINRELALKIGWLTETNELGPNLCQDFIGGDVPDFKGQPKLKDLFIFKNEYTGTEWKAKKKFVYWDVAGQVLQLSMACNWRFIHLKHAIATVVGSPNRTLHVYSHVGGSGIVGNQVTDLLREIQYVRRGRGTTYFEPLHVQYLPLRNDVMEVVETQISETEGQLVRFGKGQTIVTLHFKREL